MDFDRREFLKVLGGGMATALVSGSVSSLLSGCVPSFKPADGKVVILGFDGVSSTLFEEYLGEGHFPNCEKLMNTGCYSPMNTTNPSESPVCWSSFAVGGNPGQHGIYDFLKRDPDTYMPSISTVEKESPEFLFGLIPIKKPKVMSNRGGMSFWRKAAMEHIKTTGFQIPVTLPPEEMLGGTLISGLGVPDIRQTQGTYQYYGTDLSIDEAGSTEFGGIMHRILVVDNKVRTHLEGPPDPTKDGFHPIKKGLNFRIDGNSVIVEVDGKRQKVKNRTFSDWFEIEFQITPLVSVKGVCKFFVESIKPDLRIYLSPIDIHPVDPPIPICEPDDITTKLAEEFGPFRTRGWAITNMALTEERVDEEIFMKELWDVENMRRKLAFHLYDNDPSDLFISVFQATDRVQHAFFRLLDPSHSRYDAELDNEYHDEILNVYKFMDDTVGDMMKRIDDDTTLIVMSDHGFHSFRKGVNLNTWLVKNGFMKLKGQQEDTTKTLDDLFGQGKFWPNVDWRNTKAYAIGLGQIYINLIGRERYGSVLKGREYDQVVDDIVKGLEGLTDEDGTEVVHGCYKRDDIFKGPYIDKAPDLQLGFADGYRVSWQTCLGGIPKDVIEINDRKWSGDHCSLEPSLTKGIVLSNRKIEGEPSIIDIHPTALKELGVDIPEAVEGTPWF